MNRLHIDEIKAQAEREVADERRRQAIDAEKEKLRRKVPLLDRVFPWKITVTRKDSSRG